MKMKKVYFTPGPSELYFTYADHHRHAIREQIGSISHRDPAFMDLYAHTVSQLKELLQIPANYQLVFTSSATECWERIAQNLVHEKSHHFVHGDFGMKFYQVANDLDKGAVLTNIQSGYQATQVAEKLIALTMNETSTGYQHTIEDLAETRSKNPDALIALDVVSAAPAVPIDFSLIDTSYFSVQKCFGLPAGLGVWIVNDRCLEIANKAPFPSYHSLPNLLKMGAKNQTPETPNVLGIYLLGKIAEDMNRRGINAIRSEINYKAALLYQTIEEHPHLSISITDKAHRSKTTIVANCPDGNERILESMAKKGMILGTGYGKNSGDQIRIANFPTHSKEQVELLCDALIKFK
jgi:phosphoserine aminotransferase